MAASLTFPSVEPGVGTKKRSRYNILRADYGDGYSQRASNGRNHKREIWDVVFDNVSVAEAATIESFVDARFVAGEAFLWTPPHGGGALQFTVEEGSLQISPQRGGQTVTITAIFIQEFDL